MKLTKFILIFIFVFSYAQDITIQLNWKYQFEFAGFIMAKEKGFYKKEGLNVTLKEWDTKLDIIKSVLDNNNTYGIYDCSIIKHLNENLRILTPILKDSPIAIAIIGYKNIKSLKDLIKYNIPISKYILDSAPLLAMFKSEGIDINKLNLVDTYAIGDFIKHKGAYLIYTSNEPYTLKKHHIPFKIFKPKDYGFIPYGDIFFTLEKLVQTNPQQVNKIIKATKEGWRYAINHIDETIKVILKKYNTQNFTYDKLKYEAKILAPIINFNDINIYKANNIKNMYLFLGLINKNINLSNFIYRPIILDKKTKQFIQNTTIKCMSIGNWPPFNIEVNGHLKGISVDYWNLIKEKTGIKSECHIENNLNKVFQAIKEKKADITISTAKTPDKEKYAVFSKPYISFSLVIATKNNIGFIEDLRLLNNKTIAIKKNYTIEKILKKHYPNLNIITTNTINEALELVNDSKVFGIVDILPIIAYNINKEQYPNLKISGKLPYNFQVMFMLRKDYSNLLPVINNAIDLITQQEKNQISQKWMPILYETGISIKTFKTFILSVSIIIILFIIWIIIKELQSKKQKQLQKDLINAKEIAEHASKIKSEFLANMSHEIRTPLNAMFGFIQILQQENLSEDIKKHLDIIEKSGENLLSIINDILDFSKLESGKLHIENIEFNPKEEIEVIHHLFSHEASKKNILLKIEQTNLKYNIISDPIRLKQIIANLLNNAIKFTPKDKTITLKINYNEKKGTLFVSVKDEGIGIAQEKLTHIFEAFSQADSSTTRKYGGTGLGLTISYKLVHLLGGELKVESELGKGSKFYFTIPVKKGKTITKQFIKNKHNEKHKTYNYHILLVEDNKANQMFMKVLLKKLGITYDIANDGIEALTLYQKNHRKYDLILMDENMPNMNGIEATKQIRIYEKTYHLTHTKISALTANAIEGDKEKFILAGMDFYLSKPLDIEKLKEILDKL